MRSANRVQQILLSFILLLLSLNVSALEPNIRFQRLNLEQGLSQESVSSIIQDRQGFMWFGTQEGLNRYGGYSFKVFLHDKADSGSISSDWVFSLAEDYKGQLWVGTEGGGLNRFDPVNQKFIHYKQIRDDSTSLSNDRVRVIFNDSQGQLWVGTENGLNRFNPEENSFQRFIHHPLDNNSLSDNKIRSIVEDTEGYLWVTTNGGGLNRFDPQSRTFSRYKHDPNNPSSIISNKLNRALVDRSGNLWVGSYDKGASLLKKGETKFQHFVHSKADSESIASNNIHDIRQDTQDNIWLATDNGLSLWKPETTDFINLAHDPLNNYSLASSKVRSLYHDKGGVFWVGTISGLNKWNSTTRAFKHLRNRPGNKTSLSDNGVNAIEQTDDGQIWIGTYGGLNQLDGEKIRQFHVNPNRSNSLSSKKVMALHADKQQRLWIGTKETGLDRFDLKTETFKNYRSVPDDPKSLDGDGVTAIKPAKGDMLWVTTFGGGLNLFDPKLETFTHFRHDPKRENSLSSDNVLSLSRESSGLLWIGTWGGGLNLFNPKTNESIVYKNTPEDSDSISSDNIFSLHQDKEKNLWIGTAGGGLNKLAIEDQRKGLFKFTEYNRHQGLPSSSIFAIEEDEAGNLWLSSSRGLTKFDPKTETFLNFDDSHGLQGNEFNFGAGSKDAQGNLYFGGTNGLTVFKPTEIKPNSHVPPVVLTKFLKMNLVDSENFSGNKSESIKIHYEDYFVAFEFASLDYAKPSNNQYRYFLEGFDYDWVDAGNLRRATYTNLPAGNYTFRVKASNNDGIWNEHGIDLAVTVLPPPWKAWWAFLGYFIIGLVALAYSIKFNLNRLAKASRYRVELETEVLNRTEELQVVNKQLLNASVTDQLTGLHNRRHLDEIIEKEVADIDRGFFTENRADTSRSRLFFLMVDLDDFKPINDTYGHSAGDHVIRDVSELLQQTCRHSDTVIRWGGDEFLVMGRVTDTTEVNQFAERLRKNIQAKVFDIGLEQKLQLSCSIGFAFYPFSRAFPKLLAWEQVQIVADKALYRSKELGRNAWVGILESDKRPPVSFMPMLTQSLQKVVELDLVNLVEHAGNSSEQPE